MPGDAGRYIAEKFTTNKFAAYLPRMPHQAFYLQLTERKIFSPATPQLRQDAVNK